MTEVGPLEKYHLNHGPDSTGDKEVWKESVAAAQARLLVWTEIKFAHLQLLFNNTKIKTRLEILK